MPIGLSHVPPFDTGSPTNCKTNLIFCRTKTKFLSGVLNSHPPVSHHVGITSSRNHATCLNLPMQGNLGNSVGSEICGIRKQDLILPVV